MQTFLWLGGFMMPQNRAVSPAGAAAPVRPSEAYVLRHDLQERLKRKRGLRFGHLRQPERCKKWQIVRGLLSCDDVAATYTSSRRLKQ